jgi:hypothetical protein
MVLGIIAIAAFTASVAGAQPTTTTIGNLPTNTSPSPSAFTIVDDGNSHTWKSTLQTIIQAVLGLPVTVSNGGTGLSSLSSNQILGTNGSGGVTQFPIPLATGLGGTGNTTGSISPTQISGGTVGCFGFSGSAYGHTNCLDTAGTGLTSTGATVGVATNGVTNSLLAQMPAKTIKGNNTGSTANAADLTVAQALMLINGGPTKPTGRLTLTSGSPVMTSDVVNASSIFYTPYQGALVPIFDGTNWQMWPFSEQTLTLNSGHITAGSVYDVYESVQSGAPTICSSPAWTSTTSRASTPIQMQNGISVNTNAMTGSCWNGTTAFTVAALAGTYLGSLYCTTGATSPNCVTMQYKPTPVSGGTNNILGLYNAYNQASTRSLEADSNTTSYAVSVINTWQAAGSGGGSTGNRVWVLDGLGQSQVTCSFQMNVNSSSGFGAYGCDRNSITATPLSTAFSNAAAEIASTSAPENFSPLLGLSFYSAMIESNQTSSVGFIAALSGFQFHALSVALND